MGGGGFLKFFEGKRGGMVKISEGKKGGGHFFLEAIERLNITEGGSLIISYLSLCRREWGGGGCLFEAGRLITFSALRMGAYSRRALIRGWALIGINTVNFRPSA